MESNIHEMDPPPKKNPTLATDLCFPDVFFFFFFLPGCVFIRCLVSPGGRVNGVLGAFSGHLVNLEGLRGLMGDLAMLLPVAARPRLESESSPS